MEPEIVAVRRADFAREVLQAELPVLVDFWAAWCVPCRMVAPVLEQIARERAGELKIAKLDIDRSPKVAARFGVRSIPTLILFVDGQERVRILGARGRDHILKRVDPFLPGREAEKPRRRFGRRR